MNLRMPYLLSLSVLTLGLLVPTSGQEPPVRPSPRRGPELGEPRDIALRRLQALHDMYATETDKTDYDRRRIERAPDRRPGGPIPRTLPINYSGRDVEYRLQLLIKESGRKLSGRMLRPLAAPGAGAAQHWNNLGPANFAGRVSAVAVDPTKPMTIYRGTAGGGVWKSTDGGLTWTPTTDALGNLSVGALAVAPSQPSTLYVGTGEGALGIDGIDGIGVVKSTDGGGTWTLPVSVSAAKFFALSVHPTRPDEILAATSAGIQKSVDGGATWTRKFSRYAGTALARMPDSPSTILATVWDISSNSPTWNGFIYRSTDDGETWTEVGGPQQQPFDMDTGRLSLAISPSAPSTVYALAATASGDSRGCQDDPVDQLGVYRSTDGGVTWTFRSNPVTGNCSSGFESILAGQGWYANSLRVANDNAGTVYAGGLNLWKSTDGGVTWIKKSRWDLDPSDQRYVHADLHDLVWAGNRLLIGNDGGLDVTSNGGTSFSGLNQGIPTRQYYSIGMTPADPTLITGGAQDNGTNIRVDTTSTYREVIGGDGFGVAVHGTDPTILYGTVYYSRIFRSTDAGQTFDEVTPNFDRDENRPFISPLTMDPNDSSILYTGSNFLWRSTNGGVTWQKASNTDLGDGSRRGYLTKIAVARSDSKRLLVATGAGVVRKSLDSGASWTIVSGLPKGYASHVEFDPSTAATFYVSFVSSGAGGRLFKTTDDGSSFTRIDQGLPEFPIHVVRVDPKSSITLYVGTDVGLYRSPDGGASWSPFGAGLPAVSVWDIGLFPDGSIMRVATHGRGFYGLRIAPPTHQPVRRAPPR